jgi:hypothetical protein
MRARAPRQLARLWRASARGAGLALSFWLAGQGVSAQTILSAEFSEPTPRYDHAILGDALEWGALTLALSDGTRRLFRLPETLVFEDLTPRLADLDGDGAPEVIVVETSLAKGGRLTVWGPEGRIAQTPHIGQTHRWLAPIGAADLDGDGKVEIAYIDRPHLAKELRIWRFENGHLSEVTRAKGLTNHRIGWDYIEGGIRDCGQGPEMITADAEWRQVMASRFKGGQLRSRALGPYSPAAIADALACNG